MALAHSPRIITDGLVLCLDAANTKSYPGSGTTWTDLSGRGNNGTLTNGPTFNSSNGGSLVFDGTNDTVSITKPNPNIIGYITMSVWVKYSSYTSNPVVIHKGNHYTFLMNNSAGTDYWSYADSSNYSYANFGNRLVSGLYQTNTWMNLAVVKETTNDVKLYKNGVLVDTRTNFGSSLTSTNSTLWICGYSDTDTAPTSYLLTGNIAQVSIYNRALSAAEIQQNFNALRGRFGI